MTMPVENPMPAYIVYRDIPVGQPFDATAPLAFFPPKDSDELFDALRAEFPHLKTHSERVREAVFAYLIQEHTDEQSPATMPTPQTADTAMTSPWLSSFPSMSTDSSNFSSPEMLGLATPSFSNSPQPTQAANMSRQASVTGVVAPSSNTPPALEQMTGVFSLSDSTQPKQRIRRKMTDAEKAEYRKRRIVKACDKCSKRKRKCVHNQPEMESVAKSTQKVEKTKPAAHHKKPAVIPSSLSPDPAPDNISTSQPFIQGDDWLDFTLLDDPMPEISFDELLQPDLDRPLQKQQYLHFQQPWGADEDFSAMLRNDAQLHPNFDGQTFGDGLEMQQGLLFDDLHANGSTLSFTTGNKKYPVGIQPQQQHLQGAFADGMQWTDLDVRQDVVGQETHHATRQQRIPYQNADSGDAMIPDLHYGDIAGDPSSYSGATAPRKELTRNIKNPIAENVLQHYFDGGDRSIHQSESTTKAGRELQANAQNRTNVRNVEGAGTKDMLQSANKPHRANANVLRLEAYGTLENATAFDKQATGALHARDPSTELYRLRHRVPSGPRLLQTIPRTQDDSRTDSQADGGTYLRLDASLRRQQATQSLTGLSAILPATGGSEKPAHTRSRNPTITPGSNDPLQDGNDTTQAGNASASGMSHSSRTRAHGRPSLAQQATARSAQGSVDSSSDFYYDWRMQDTVRYRDHFGRLALTTICAAVLLLCAAQGTQSYSSLSLSTLLLAAFAPTPSADSLMGIMGKRNWKSYRKTAGGGEASTNKSKFHGWVMTPHSSLRWSVGVDWTALCG